MSAALAGAHAERDAAVNRAREIAADREAMLNQFKVLSADTLDRHSKAADAQAEHRLKATEQLMVPVRESLDRFGARLTEVEKERSAISAELRTQVATVRQTGETLRRETTALVSALRKPQIRGSWGETQLKRVAEIAGMLDRCDFDLQHTSRDDDRLLRPDMRVNLAEGKHLFVDAKAPLTAFLEAAETEDDTVQAEALTRYARHVRTHIDQLSSKQYWKAAESPEFVVLFLPNEMFFAAALDQMPDLYDYAAARDVVLATPTTLIGLLRAVAYGWKQAALAESAAEVFRLGRDLHARLGLMGNRLDKLGRALRSSVNAYNETIATVEGGVLVRARRFRDLKVSDERAGRPPPARRRGAPDPGAGAGRRRGAGGADGRPGPDEAGRGPRRRRPSWSAASPTCSRWSRPTWSPAPTRTRSVAPPEGDAASDLVRRTGQSLIAPARRSRRSSGGSANTRDSSVSRSSRAAGKPALDQEVQHSLDQVLRHRGAAGDADRADPVQPAASISPALSTR